MIIRLQCVMMDGEVPASGAQKLPYEQPLDGATEVTLLDGTTATLPGIPAGTDVEFEIDFFGQDGVAFDMTGYTGVITCKRTRTSTTSVFANAITMSGTSGTSFATHSDTVDEDPRTCVYDVQVESAGGKTDQPIPQSNLVILPAIGSLDDTVVAAGPDMLIVGIAAPDATELGMVIVPTDDDPATLAWTASPFEVVTGAAAIDAGALIKASATASQYETLGAADDAGLMVGVAKTACSGAASTFQGYFIAGIVTPMLSDGTDTIAAGASVEPSTTVAGRVKAGDTNVIGYNVGAAVAATLNASVSVR
jgi:hypothetical protein